MKAMLQAKQRGFVRRHSVKGFSLIELLIVVAIILIIAAIAIPNLLKSKMMANEASAVESLRTIDTGETTYAATCPDVGFSATLVELNTGALCVSGKNIIDNILGGADPSNKAGYIFTYTVAPIGGLNNAFTVTALPSTVGVTGQRGFFSDQTNVVRFTLNGIAPTAASPALQ
jgi:prepilin-type N-terminal cleavage/methylation domain-containing protein